MGSQNSRTGQRQEEFRIGLSLSGAISAGAYTAGVFDFLIQALEEWEKARRDITRDDVPDHRVHIPVLAGASAGAITAAVGVAALPDDHVELKFGGSSPLGGEVKCIIPKLYDAWVEKPTFVASKPCSLDFLDLSDIYRDKNEPGRIVLPDYSCTSLCGPSYPGSNGNPITSVLNTSVLDGIADAAITPTAGAPREPRDYFAKTLHLYMTLANLRGVPYSIKFVNGEYGMLSHGDRAHFVIGGVGNWDYSSPWADIDTKRELEVKWLYWQSTRGRWQDYAICALASAAFPVGLSPRSIGFPFESYQGNAPVRRQFPLDSFEQLRRHLAHDAKWPIRPDDPWPTPDATAYRFVSVDGGVIDNDPFQYVRFTLGIPPVEEAWRIDEKEPIRDAIVMVAPFPEPPPMLPEGRPTLDIFSIISALAPTWKDQARFKPDELVLAASPDVGSRYIVKPERTENIDGEDRTYAYAIACGVLGGFGGFMDRSFREHDYQLGRRNCQHFLRRTLTVSKDHPMVKSWTPKMRANPAVQADSEGQAYCLIPLLGSASEEIHPAKLLPWPRMAQKDFDTLQARLGVRLNAVAAALLGQGIKRWGPWMLLRFALWLQKNKIRELAKEKILSDLVRRDQIVGWEPPPGFSGNHSHFYAVVAELVDPAYDQRSVAGLARYTRLDTAQIREVIDSCKSSNGLPYEVWEAPWKDANGHELYALATRKPFFATFKKILGPSLFVSNVDAPGVERGGVLAPLAHWVRSKMP